MRRCWPPLRVGYCTRQGRWRGARCTIHMMCSSMRLNNSHFWLVSGSQMSIVLVSVGLSTKFPFSHPIWNSILGAKSGTSRAMMLISEMGWTILAFLVPQRRTGSNLMLWVIAMFQISQFSCRWRRRVMRYFFHWIWYFYICSRWWSSAGGRATSTIRRVRYKLVLVIALFGYRCWCRGWVFFL